MSGRKRLDPAAAARVFGLSDFSAGVAEGIRVGRYHADPAKLEAAARAPELSAVERSNLEAAHAAAFASAVGAALRAGVRLLDAEGLRGKWRGVLAARYPKGIGRGEPLAHFLPSLPGGLSARLTVCGRIKRAALADVASGAPCPDCVAELAQRLARRGADAARKVVL